MLTPRVPLRTMCFVVCCFFLLSAKAKPAIAQQPMPKKSGFSGYVELLGGYFTTDSQLNTDDENKRTDSLNSSGNRIHKFRPMPLGLINYTFAEKRTQLFLGMLPENLSQGQFQVEVGVRHIIKNGTDLRASFIPMSPFQQEAWKDPFVVGEDRHETDIQAYGFKLVANRIWGSEFNLKYGYANRDIDDEESGRFLFSQPDSSLDEKDLDSLKRDADFHRLTIEYSFRLAPRMRLKPAVRYTRSDAEGEANSFHSLRPELTFLYFGDQIQVSATAFYRGTNYDRINPVFQKKRQDDTLGLFAIFSYKNPFQLNNFRIDWFNLVSQSNSNINFYESTNFVTALGVGYTF